MCCHLITLFKRVFYQRDNSLQIIVKKTKPSRTGLLTGQQGMEPPEAVWQSPPVTRGHWVAFPCTENKQIKKKKRAPFHLRADSSVAQQFVKAALVSLISPDTCKGGWLLHWALPSCSFSVVPTFLIFLGDFIKRGKMVRKPRMSTNLWQLSVPSGPIMAWSSTFRALLREIFFSLGTKEVLHKAFHEHGLVLKKKKKKCIYCKIHYNGKKTNKSKTI